VWEIFNTESTESKSATVDSIGGGGSNGDRLASSGESHQKSKSVAKANGEVGTCAAVIECRKDEGEGETSLYCAESDDDCNNPGREESKRSLKKKKENRKEAEDYGEEDILEDMCKTDVDESLKPSKKKKKVSGGEGKQDECDEKNTSAMKKKKKKHHLSAEVEETDLARDYGSEGFQYPGVNGHYVNEENHSLEIPKSKRKKKKIEEKGSEIRAEENEIIEKKTDSSLADVEKKFKKKKRKKHRDEDGLVEAPKLKKPKMVTSEKENFGSDSGEVNSAGGKTKKKKSKKVAEGEIGCIG